MITHRRTYRTNKRWGTLLALTCLAVSLACGVSVGLPSDVLETPDTAAPTQAATVNPAFLATQVSVPTFTPGPQTQAGSTPGAVLPNTGITPPGFATDLLSNLYDQINPGVVSIRVFLTSHGLSGEAAGSGFVIDPQGHIVTNNHVIEGSQNITVIYYNGVEAAATVVGADQDSDLAVLQVDGLPEGVHALNLGDSDQVKVGEWVVAIGNPFGHLGNSMSFGIVSALGREIPSGVAQYSIPQAIQTDAAINPGNSGGPLINLRGEVVGVNAQIATNGVEANAGVGFAIPSNIVRRVAPVLIERGGYEWPYLGISGDSVNLPVMRANNLETQFGAYVATVTSGGPAERAGLHGSTGSVQDNGLEVPVGGDVIIEVDGKQIIDYGDLLSEIIAREPGDTMVLTIIRDGQRQQVEVTLAPRP